MIHNIVSDSLVPHGDIKVSTENGEIRMIQNTDINAYICLPDKYKLPFRVDMTASINAPSLRFKIGNGHIELGTGIMSNSRMSSIMGNKEKPNTYKFNHDIPLNEYFNISIIYGRKLMQLTINGEVRYSDNKDKYMKSPLLETEFKDGFHIMIRSEKRTELSIKSLTVREYGDDEPEYSSLTIPEYNYSPCLSNAEKPTLDECIKGLSQELQNQILRTDDFLRNDMKFKRKIEGGYPSSRIHYKSSAGLIYTIKISDAYITDHSIKWNIKTLYDNRVLRTKCIVSVLDRLAEDSPEFAEEMFLRMKECNRCRKDKSNFDSMQNNHGCVHNGIYEYNGKKKFSCGGSMNFKMFPSDFEDVRNMILVINDVLLENGISK